MKIKLISIFVMVSPDRVFHYFINPSDYEHNMNRLEIMIELVRHDYFGYMEEYNGILTGV